MNNTNPIGKIKNVTLSEEVKRSYLDYAMSVIVSRALPDVRDGLKPVHRRILYAMYRMGMTPKSPFSKSAKVVGEVLGKYHPHGDASIYDALVRMAQEFSMRYPLIQGQGNFGSIDGDAPAAMRYTEARPAKISIEMLKDIDRETVPFIPNFDATIKEPQYLPALLPNLLLMGSEGIAVGMATKIPPHNLKEVCEAIIATIDKGQLQPQEDIPHLQKENQTPKKESKDSLLEEMLQAPPDKIKNYLLPFESQITSEEILNYIKGPDFPTAGAIFDAQEIKNTYQTGRGKILMRGRAEIEEIKKNRLGIVIYELPYQVNKAQLVEKIAQLIREQKIKGVADLRDESDRQGIRIVLELQRSARPKAILNNLFKKTELETTFPANFVALVDGIPQTLNIKQILVLYISHRQEIVTRRLIFKLKEARARAHILEGLKIALDHLDEVIETIKKSRNTEVARTNLIKNFGLSEIQANAILEMQLKRLSQLERQKIEEEYQQIKKEIDKLTDFLTHPQKILAIIKKELQYLIKTYGDERKTRVFAQSPGEFSEKDLIPNEKTIIAITKEGYIKRMNKTTYRSQRRGGKGVTGMTTKEEDQMEQLLAADTHDKILFFTNQGRVFSLPVWEIPEGNRQARGKAIVNLINIDNEEKVEASLILKEKLFSLPDHYLFLVTKRGVVKKTPLKEFKKIRTTGLIAIVLRKNDRLCEAKLVKSGNHILLVSAQGQAIRFPEKEVRPTARDTIGVAGINLKEGDEIVATVVFSPQLKPPRDKRIKVFRHLLVVTQKGMGKRTNLELFPVQHRRGKGIKIAKITEKTGQVSAVRLVTEKDQTVIITSKEAHIIKLPIRNIPLLGRNTQGVILMRFTHPDDEVASIAVLKKTEEEKN